MTNLQIKDSIDKEKQIKDIVSYTENISTEVDVLKISSPETQETGLRLIKHIKQHIKTIEAKRKEYSVPLNNILKALNTNAKSVREPLEKMERVLRNKLTDYQMALEAKRREEERKKQEKEAALQAELEAAENAKDQQRVEKKMERLENKELTTPDKTVYTKDTTASFRDVWKWEVEDVKKIPREFLMLNTVAVNNTVRAGVRKIAGIRIYESKETIIR